VGDRLAIALAITVAVAVPLVLIGSVFLAVRRSDQHVFSVDLQAMYLYIVALVSLMIAMFTVFSLVETGLSLAFQTYMPPPPEANRPKPVPPDAEIEPVDVGAEQNRYQRQALADRLAALLVTLPVWWYHWRTAARRAVEREAFLGYRIYVYAIMVVALIATVVSGGQALASLLQWLLGAINWNEYRAVENFWRSAMGAAANSLVALGLWMYHRRALALAPTE
jgi:hypothetical protein